MGVLSNRRILILQKKQYTQKLIAIVDFAWESYLVLRKSLQVSALCELLCSREGYSIFVSTDSHFLSRAQI